MKAGTRVALYRRVSALMGRSGEDFHSPEMQTTAMRRHIEPSGAHVVAELEDIDVSGRTFQRAGLDKIRDLVEAGRIDAVAVYDLSRLGRNVADSLNFINFLRDRRVGIISTVEKIDDTPEGQFMLTQFLALAQLYSDQIGRRWVDVHLRVVEQGRHHGAVPMGYRRGSTGLEVDPVLAHAVAEALRDYAGGKPVGQIADKLGAARGKPVSRQVVKRMVANPIYVGKVGLWRGEKYKKWSAKPVALADGRHEPLIDQDTYDACVRRCREDSTTPPRSLAPSHPFARIIRCGLCELGVTIDGKSPRRYRCRAQSVRRGCTGCGSITAEVVATVARRELADYLSRLQLPIGQEKARLISQRRPVEDSPQAAQRELEAIRSEMTRLANGWAKGIIPDHSYESLMVDARRREAAVETRQGAALAARPAAVDVGQVVAAGRKVLALWDAAEPWELNEGLRIVGMQLTLWPRGDERPTADKRVQADFPEP